MDWLEIIEQSEQTLQYRQSKRAKRLSLRVIPGGQVELVLPYPLPSSSVITSFLVEHQNWIHKHAQACHNNPLAWPKPFASGQTIPLLGRRVPLTVCFESKYSAGARFVDGSGLVVNCLSDQCSEQWLKQIVLQWYQKAAQRQVEKVLVRYVPLVGYEPSMVKIRASRQVWGALDSSGRMTINWLLLLAPASVLSYVVLHELCHFFERRHNRRFWKKVAQYDPKYLESERWLKKNGLLLKQP